MMSQTGRDSEELQVAPSERRLIKPLVGSTEALVMEIKASEVPAEKVHQEANSGNLSMEKMGSTSSTSGQSSSSSELKRTLESERPHKSSDEAASEGEFFISSSSQVVSIQENAVPIAQDQMNRSSTSLGSENSTFKCDGGETVDSNQHFTPEKGELTGKIREEAEKKREDSISASNQVQTTGVHPTRRNERSVVGAETSPGPDNINQEGPTLPGKEVNMGPPEISAGKEERQKQERQSEHKTRLPRKTRFLSHLIFLIVK